MSASHKHVAEWLNQGVITPQVAAEITRYEAAKPVAGWMRYSFYALGAVTIGIGIISLIAANWETIPDAVKLGFAFAGVGWLAWNIASSAVGSLRREILLQLFILAILALIGLIAQVYHLGGKLENALLAWTLLTLPGATLATRQFIPLMWCSAFIGSGVFWIFSHLDAEEYGATILFTLPLLCVIGSWWLRRGVTDELSAATRINFAAALEKLALLGGVTAIFAADAAISNNGFGSDARGWYLVCLVGGLVLIGGVNSERFTPVQKLVLGLALGCYLTLYFLGRLPMGELHLLGAGGSIVTIGAYGVLLGLLGRRRAFQWAVNLMGLRFLGAYFTAAGGLAVTGIGLVISGGVIIGVVRTITRHRVRLERWLGISQ